MNKHDYPSLGFFALMQELEQSLGPRFLNSPSMPVRIAPVSHLGFGSSDVLSADDMPSGQVVMRMGFLGLTGATSPLPGYLTQALALDDDRYKPLQHLLELLNHRLYALYYKAWLKHRPWMSPALLHRKVRANGVRSELALAHALKTFFDVEDVVIDSFAACQETLPKKVILGSTGARLGVDTLLGETSSIAGLHFKVTLLNIDSIRFMPLVNSNLHWIQEIRSFISQFLTSPFSFTIRVEQKIDLDSLCNHFDSDHFILGGTSFIGLEPNECFSKEFYFV